MAEIKLEMIAKSFGQTPVLKRIDLDIRDGEFISLVGPSGCGKSTLLRIVAGLEQQSSGHVLIGEKNVDGTRSRDRDLAMVFQSYALYPHLTVAENIAVPLTMRRLSTLERSFAGSLLPAAIRKKKEIVADVDKVCKALSIETLKARKPAALSGGQRQRVALARAMVRKPSAFLMDEPLSNLDAKLRVQARGEIAELHRQLGATFIYVTHDQAEAMTMSDRIAVMLGGELLQLGTPDEVYRTPHDLRVAEFIGSPKINVADAVLGDSNEVATPPTCLAGTPVRIAFRPEAAGLSGEAGADFAGKVQHIENLGSDLYVQMRADHVAEPFTIRVDPAQARPAPGDRAGVMIDDARIHVFGQDNRRMDGHFRLRAGR